MTLTTLVDGRREVRELAEGSYMIGRGESCRIRFPFPDVSERHAILTFRGGEVTIEDLHSANGTLVNGDPIDGRVALTGSMIVQIGSCMLRVSEDAGEEPAECGAGEQPVQDVTIPSGAEEPVPADPTPDPMRELRRSVQEQIQRELLKRMDMKRLTVQGVDREGLEERAQATLSSSVRVM